MTTYRNGDYRSGIDINAGISLPVLAHSTWNITPSISAT